MGQKKSKVCAGSLIIFMTELFLLSSLGLAREDRITDPPSSHRHVDGVKAAIMDPYPDVLVELMGFEVPVKALEQIEETESAITSRLLELLADPDPVFREAAIKALGWIGRPQAQIAKHAGTLLHDPYPPVVVGALWSLGRIGVYVAPYLEEIKKYLYSPHEAKIRLAAIRAIATIAEEKIPSLNRSAYEFEVSHQLEDPDLDIVWETARTMVRIGTFTTKDLPGLMQGLQTDDWDTGKAAVAILANMGEGGKPYIPKLRLWLQHSKPQIRLAAARAIGQLGTVALDALPQLLVALQDSHASVRAEAALAIGKVGYALQPHLPLLISKLDDYDLNVRLAVAQTFANLDAATVKTALPSLLSMLQNANSRTREAAAVAIGHLGPVANEFTEQLAALAEDSALEVRAAAAFALSRVDPPCGTALAPLLYLLDNANQHVSWAAAKALTRCGPLPDLERDVAVWSFIVQTLLDPRRLAVLRFLAHYIGGGVRETEVLLAWVGHPAVYPNNLSRAETLDALIILLDAGQRTKPIEVLALFREEVAKQSAIIVDQIQWNRSDIPFLKEIASSFGDTAAGLASQRILDRFYSSSEQ